MPSRSISPEDVRKLRAIYRTKHEFLIEHNVISEDHHPPSREELRELCGRLVHSEREALRARIHRRLDRLEELMYDDVKRFDEPAVEHSDLVSGVRIPNFHD